MQTIRQADAAPGEVIHCPHFLGIGAQRSATSWLNEQLGRHPELWLPPLKELHYFDAIDSGGKKPVRRLKKDFPRLLRKTLKRYGWFSRWERRFLFGRESDAWYRSLFVDAAEAGKVTGEVTPAYALLSGDLIRRIHHLNPQMRIIFFMRDPIDRSWSVAMKKLCRDREKRFDEVGKQSFLDQFREPENVSKSSYMSSIESWEAVFPPEQIFYGFFEEVEKDPVELLGRIFTFLGVEPEIASAKVTHTVRNQAAKGTRIPVEFERVLAQQYLKETESLARRFGGYARKWHDRCLHVMAEDPLET